MLQLNARVCYVTEEKRWSLIQMHVNMSLNFETTHNIIVDRAEVVANIVTIFA